MYKNILNSICTQLQGGVNAQILDIKYISTDWGQLDYYAPEHPVKYPCALVSIDTASYSNNGRSQQMAEATAIVKIATLRLGNVSNMAPQLHKDNGQKIFDTLEGIVQLLHGYSPTINCSALIRTLQKRVKRDDGVEMYEIHFSLMVKDNLTLRPQAVAVEPQPQIQTQPLL